MRKPKKLSIKQLCNQHYIPSHTILLELRKPGTRKNTKNENILAEMKAKDMQTHSATFKIDNS